MVEKSMVKGLS